MKLDIVPFKDVDDYPEYEIPSALYSPAFRNISKKNHSKTLIDDYSFSITQGGRLLAYCLLTANLIDVDKPKKLELWGLGYPALFWCVENTTHTERILCGNFAIKMIQKYINSYNIQHIQWIDFFQGGILNEISKYLMQQSWCNPKLCFNNIILLDNDINILHSQLRKSYKSFINKANKIYNFYNIDKNNFINDHIEILHKCHIVAAGRDVYLQTFWNNYSQLIREGHAFMVFGEDDSAIKGASLYIVSGQNVYYGIGAYDRSLNDTGLSHASMWNAIIYAKRKGYEFFETGRTYYASLSPNITEKEMSIGFFKRGFGGINKPVLVLE